jgi:hypothetical protein
LIFRRRILVSPFPLWLKLFVAVLDHGEDSHQRAPNLHSCVEETYGSCSPLNSLYSFVDVALQPPSARSLSVFPRHFVLSEIF